MIEWLRKRGEREFTEDNIPPTLTGLVGFVADIFITMACWHIWRFILPIWARCLFWWSMRKVPKHKRPKLSITWERAP